MGSVLSSLYPPLSTDPTSSYPHLKKEFHESPLKETKERKTQVSFLALLGNYTPEIRSKRITTKNQILSFFYIGPKTYSDRFCLCGRVLRSSASIADQEEARCTCLLAIPGAMPSDGCDDDGLLSVVFSWCLVPGLPCPEYRGFNQVFPEILPAYVRMCSPSIPFRSFRPPPWGPWPCSQTTHTSVPASFSFLISRELAFLVVAMAFVVISS